MSELKNYIAKTYAGFEQILFKELHTLGVKNPEIIRRGVRFQADEATLYKALYQSRLALRIMLELGSTPIKDKKELYDFVYNQPWNKWFTIDKSFAVDSILRSELFNHSHYVSLLVKDAIVDRFRKEEGYRPDVEPKYPDIRIAAHLIDDQFTLLLDAAGEALFKRGYRSISIEAPLSEVLAAGLIEMSGWDPQQAFVDPMCGSGTLITEALMKSTNMPAGFFRQEYSVQNWTTFQPELWTKIVDEARANIYEPEGFFQGSDISPAAVKAARQNLAIFECEDFIDLSVCDIAEVKPKHENGILVTNPPYGERLNPENLDAIYKTLGDTLKKHFAGYTAWVFSAHTPGLKKLGLRTNERIHLKNGPLDCRYYKYELFKGSAKAPKKND